MPICPCDVHLIISQVRGSVVHGRVKHTTSAALVLYFNASTASERVESSRDVSITASPLLERSPRRRDDDLRRRLQLRHLALLEPPPEAPDDSLRLPGVLRARDRHRSLGHAVVHGHLRGSHSAVVSANLRHQIHQRIRRF